MDGVKQIQKKLQQMPAKLQRRAIKKAANAGANPLVKNVKQNAPVDSGVLRRNIKKQRWKSRYFADVISVGVESGSPPVAVGNNNLGLFEKTIKGKVVFVAKKTNARQRRGDDPFYKRFVEKGYTHKKSGKKVKGQDFIKDSVPKAGNQAIDAYYNKLKKDFGDAV